MAINYDESQALINDTVFRRSSAPSRN